MRNVFPDMVSMVPLVTTYSTIASSPSMEYDARFCAGLRIPRFRAAIRADKFAPLGSDSALASSNAFCSSRDGKFDVKIQETALLHALFEHGIVPLELMAAICPFWPI